MQRSEPADGHVMLMCGRDAGEEGQEGRPLSPACEKGPGQSVSIGQRSTHVTRDGEAQQPEGAGQ